MAPYEEFGTLLKSFGKHKKSVKIESPQSHLVPMVKASLPNIRRSLANEESFLAGITPPSMAQVGLNCLVFRCASISSA